MEWLTGADGSASEPVATDGLGFDDEVDDFDDEMDGFDDGMDGFDDDMGGFDDEMDGFDDGMGDGMDDFGSGMDGRGDVDADTVAEMEDRISELENEVSSTTSEMNTVREENKQIGETVEELDDTVRKLLDIYEMVTRGINPFVDDAREMGGLESEGAFGLFDVEEESEDELDPDVANSDPEAFFDEDFGDIDANEDEAELAAGDELAGEERADPATTLDDDSESENDSSDGGGTSFDELKSEYEENGDWEDVDGRDDEAGGGSGLDEAVEGDAFDAEGIDDPDAEEAFDTDGTDDAEGAVEHIEADDAEADGMAADSTAADDVEAGDMEADSTAADGAEAGDMAADSTAADDVKADNVAAGRVAADEVEAGRVRADRIEAGAVVESEPAGSEDGQGPMSDAGTNGANGRATADATFQPATTAEHAEHDADAYLAQIPPRYTAESVVLEWTRFLVEVGGVVGATRALRQYREQGWITRRVERTVGEHVRNAAVADGSEETRDLRVRDHRESLTYISRLAGDVDEAQLLEELSALRGGSDGIRR